MQQGMVRLQLSQLRTRNTDPYHADRIIFSSFIHLERDGPLPGLDELRRANALAHPLEEMRLLGMTA